MSTVTTWIHWLKMVTFMKAAIYSSVLTGIRKELFAKYTQIAGTVLRRQDC